MRLIICAFVAASAAVCISTPAQADPFSLAMEQFSTAQARSTAGNTRPPSGFRMTMVRTDGTRIRGRMSFDPLVTQFSEIGLDGEAGPETYITRVMMYSQSPSGQWTRTDFNPKVLSAEQTHIKAQLSPEYRESMHRHDLLEKRIKALPVRNLPDRWIGGVRYRAYQKQILTHSIDSHAADDARTIMTCQFEKATGANALCTAGKFRMTMTRDDDPAKLEIPGAALNAPVILLDWSPK